MSGDLGNFLLFSVSIISFFPLTHLKINLELKNTYILSGDLEKK